MTHPGYGALKWVGGKSGLASSGLGRWIASRLPADSSATYVEPFAGMLGVLLIRPRSAIELVNDRNGRVVNWWRCLRDEPDELLRMVLDSPNARDEFGWACENLDNPALSDVQRAAAFTTAVVCGIRSSDQVQLGDWRRSFRDHPVERRQNLVWRLRRTANRIRDVQIENRDAVEVLDRVSSVSSAVVYCDPPYPTAAQNLYQVTTVNLDDLAEVLKAQSGSVAISGYGSEWNHLGWYRSTFRTLRQDVAIAQAAERVEVLWTNYEPAGQSALF